MSGLKDPTGDSPAAMEVSELYGVTGYAEYDSWSGNWCDWNVYDPITETFACIESPWPLLQVLFRMDSSTSTTSYVIVAFDLLLGVVGGFYSLVFLIFGCCVQNYESFRAEYDLVQNFYSSDFGVEPNKIVER